MEISMLKVCLSVFTAAALSFSVSSVLAVSPPKIMPTISAEASDALAAKLATYKSLKGRFEQVLSAKDGKVLQSTVGDFSFKKPGLYLWQSDEPFPQTIVGNGETLWVYDPDLEQVTVTPQAKMPFNPATLIAGGVTELSRQYSVTQSTLGQTETYALVPKLGENDDQPPFSALSLTFEGGQLGGVLLVDRLGQETRIAFTDVKVNPVLEDAQFTFQAPAGTDVLVNE